MKCNRERQADYLIFGTLWGELEEKIQIQLNIDNLETNSIFNFQFENTYIVYKPKQSVIKQIQPFIFFKQYRQEKHMHIFKICEIQTRFIN